MISSSWKCLLLWRISILGGAFEQDRAGKKRGGGGYVAGQQRSSPGLMLVFSAVAS